MKETFKKGKLSHKDWLVNEKKKNEWKKKKKLFEGERGNKMRELIKEDAEKEKEYQEIAFRKKK